MNWEPPSGLKTPRVNDVCAHNEIPHMNREDGEESEVTRTLPPTAAPCLVSVNILRLLRETQRLRWKRTREERRGGQERRAGTLCCLHPLSGHFKIFTGAGFPLSLAKRESLRVEGNSMSREGPVCGGTGRKIQAGRLGEERRANWSKQTRQKKKRSNILRQWAQKKLLSDKTKVRSVQSRKNTILTFSSVIVPLIWKMSFHDSAPFCLANKTRHKCEVQLCCSAERRRIVWRPGKKSFTSPARESMAPFLLPSLLPGNKAQSREGVDTSGGGGQEQAGEPPFFCSKSFSAAFFS